MEFEETQLPDHPATRLAFEKAEMQVAMIKMFDPRQSEEDTGMGAASLKLFLHALARY